MNTVEIRTSQNVVIEYELARLGDRILAFAIDQVILWTSVGILIGLAYWTLDYRSADMVQRFILYPVFVFYTLSFEILLNGQTPGKRLMGLKVMKLSGREGGMSDYMIRWAFRFIDIWTSLGAVASLLISSSEKNQRLGGLLSDTVVVRLKPSRNFQLENILQIRNADSYQVSYPGVANLHDDDMLLVKNALSRQRTFRNKAHDEALEQLATVLAQRLGIGKPGDSHRFLRTLLEDYIVLTR